MSTNQNDKDVDLDAWGLSIEDVTKPKHKSKSTRYKTKPHTHKSLTNSKPPKKPLIKTNTLPIHKSKPFTRPKPTHDIDKRFEWLLQPNSSRVLKKPEINGILSYKSLTTYQRSMATDRINNILQYINCIETRKWCGLCKYDSDIRIENTIESLTSYKKVLDREMRNLFQIAPSKLTDIQKQRRTVVVQAIKFMQNLLLQYHSLVKQIRQKQRDNKEKNKMRMKNNNINNQITKPNNKWWAFGKSIDKWNNQLNSEFYTTYRGHILSDYDYNMYVNLYQNEQNQFSDDDIDMDQCQYENNVSILGPSTQVPPGINAVKIFRRKTNNHQSRFCSNLALLYGDASDLVSRPGIYRSHLLSEYDILNRVGSGVYGCVFKAKTHSTNKIVAIKTLKLLLNEKQRETIDFKQSKLLNKELVNRICPYMMIEGIPVPVIREIMSLKQLNHKNITQLYDIVLNDPFDNITNNDEHEWNFHLVQEFVPNELYAIMRNLKLLHFERNKFNSQFRNKNIDQLTPDTLPQPPYWFSCANIKSIIYDLLEGLSYLESESYIHRDLKPSNLLLTDDGVIKIADFGLSRPKYKLNELLTNAHNVVTRYYRAPEILIEQNKRRSLYSFASDMWSIGAIFGELICGRPLFRAPNDIEQIFHIIHKCGSITDKVWNGISSIITEDPPSSFIKINPLTNKPNIWLEGQKKFNFVKNMRNNYKNKSRMLCTFLRPYIANSWTQQNIKFGLDLIDKMLCYDPKKRIKPNEALKHKWFKISPNGLPPKELISKSRKSKKATHTDLQKEQHNHNKNKQNKMNNNMSHNNKNNNRNRNINTHTHMPHNMSHRQNFFADARQKYNQMNNNNHQNQNNNNKRPYQRSHSHGHGHMHGHGHHHNNNPHKKRRIN